MNKNTQRLINIHGISKYVRVRSYLECNNITEIEQFLLHWQKKIEFEKKNMFNCGGIIGFNYNE